MAMTALSLGLTTSCGTKSDDSGGAGVDSAIEMDTVILSELADEDTLTQANIPFVAEKMEEKKGQNVLEVQFPTQGNMELLQSVRQWLNEELGGTYKGDLADGKSFFRHYALQLGHDPDLNECGGYTKDDFEVEYQNDRVVTYEHSSYVNEGESHGESEERGVTFLQEDGSKFTRKCIKSYQGIHSLIVEGLKQYFKVKSDDQLLEHLSNVKSVADIQSPTIDPWITAQGVTFAYMPFEIAEGEKMPTFSIPVSKIQPYLTEEGKRFF